MGGRERWVTEGHGSRSSPALGWRATEGPGSCGEQEGEISQQSALDGEGQMKQRIYSSQLGTVAVDRTLVNFHLNLNRMS
jgi:hypothetical protein